MNITKIIAAVLFVALLIFIGKWNRERKINNNLIEATQTIQENWKFDIDSIRAIQQQVILDKNSKLAKAADTIEGLKNQKQRIKYITRTVVRRDTFTINPQSTIEIDSSTFLKLPYTLSKSTKWYGYTFTLRKYKSSLDSLYFLSETNIVWGEQDHGWLKNLYKPNTPIVYIEHKNPYTITEHVENYVFKDYKKRIKFGFQLGYGLTPKGLQPYLGVGLSKGL